MCSFWLCRIFLIQNRSSILSPKSILQKKSFDFVIEISKSLQVLLYIMYVHLFFHQCQTNLSVMFVHDLTLLLKYNEVRHILHESILHLFEYIHIFYMRVSYICLSIYTYFTWEYLTFVWVYTHILHESILHLFEYICTHQGSVQELYTSRMLQLSLQFLLIWMGCLQAESIYISSKLFNYLIVFFTIKKDKHVQYM
jgi:hypothetical protein